MFANIDFRCCWNGLWPVETEWLGTGMVICLDRGASDLHIVQLMPMPPHYLWLQ